MDNQQRTAFDQWFDSELDPELNLTPGDKELCRHAWQAALSHAEGEAPVAYLSDATIRRLASGKPVTCYPEKTDWLYIPLYTHPAPQVAVPEEREWNQAAGRDDLKYTEGWNACRDAMLAAAPTAPAGKPKCPRCRGTGQHVVGPIDCPRISVCELCKAPAQQPVSDPNGRLTVKRALDAVWEEFEFEFDPVFLEAMEGIGLIEQADGFLLSMKVAFEDALAQAAKSAPDERKNADKAARRDEEE